MMCTPERTGTICSSMAMVRRCSAARAPPVEP